MGALSELPNIGKVAEKTLMDAGVESPEALRAMGTREAFIRARGIDPGACLHFLYALEGAVRNVRKSELPAEVKAELRAFFNALG